MKYLSIIALCLLASSASAQSCQEIRFAPGASSATIQGRAGNDGVCYTFGTGAGQTATLTLQGPDTMCAAVYDVGDCATRFKWTTQRRTYRVHVSQLYRTSPVTPFALTLSIR